MPSFRFKQFLFGATSAQVLADAVAKDDVEHFNNWWKKLSTQNYDHDALINQKNAKGQTLLERAQSVEMASTLISAGIKVEVDPEIQKAADFYCGHIGVYKKEKAMKTAKLVAYLNMPTTQNLSVEKKSQWSNLCHDMNTELIKVWLSTKKQANPTLYEDPNRMWPENPSFLSQAIYNGSKEIIKLVLHRLQDIEVIYPKERNCDIINYTIYQDSDYPDSSMSLIIDTINRLDILKSFETDMKKSLPKNPWLQTYLDMTSQKIEKLEIEKEKETLEKLVPQNTITTPAIIATPGQKHKI